MQNSILLFQVVAPGENIFLTVNRNYRAEMGTIRMPVFPEPAAITKDLIAFAGGAE